MTSAIEWTNYSGGPANFVWRGKKPGDCECSPGCQNCYVMRFCNRVKNWPEVTTFYPDKLTALAKKKYKSVGQFKRPMVFVCDTGDYVHPNVTDEQVFSIWDTLYSRDDVYWQMLTKRSSRLYVLGMTWLQSRGIDKFPPWMWMGVTVESYRQLNRQADLTSLPCYVRFLSLEPLLDVAPVGGCDQYIIGGESGSFNKCRTMPIRHAMSIVDQFRDRVFFKQWGNFVPVDYASADSGPLSKVDMHGDLFIYDKTRGNTDGLPKNYPNMLRIWIEYSLNTYR